MQKFILSKKNHIALISAILIAIGLPVRSALKMNLLPF